MNCKGIRFSGHAVQRMFERNIGVNEVLEVVVDGEIIDSYPSDEPFPSHLILGFIRGKPLHVVIAEDETESECHIITVYQPDPTKWRDDYRKRRTS